MERRNILFAVVLSLVCSFIFVKAYSHNSQQPSPVGYWRTFDEKTQKPKAIVQIWKTEDNVVMGKIVKVFSENTICTHCVGENKNQPITGMTVVSGLRAKQKNWTNGKLINTENGKTYSCVIRTLDNGKRLHVQHYMGLPMLGKSQVWERVDLI